MIVYGLLDLLIAQGADALVLEPGRPPVLERKGTSVKLSMPPLTQELFDDLRAELEPQQAEGLEIRGQHFAIIFDAQSPRLTLRAPGAEDAPTDPVRAPPASPVQSPVTSGLSPAFARWIDRALHEDASDVFFSTGRPPHARRGGEVTPLADTPIDADAMAAFGSVVLGAEALERVRDHGSADVAWDWQRGGERLRFRVHAFEQMDGLAFALRPIRTDPPSLHTLGLPEAFHRLAQFRNGLVLMTGTAGSGKSTTLVALLERLSKTSTKHIVTLEDPIEYRFPSGGALVHQREVGTHVSSFAEGLRAALREAPDIILLGELRDKETIAAALTAAETGHLVLSTLHCADSAAAVERIVDVFEEHRHAQVRTELASVLRAVVSQVLLPSTTPPRRVPAYELLLVNTAVASKIREDRCHQLRSELHPGRAEGMIPMEVTLDALIDRGEITSDTARATTPTPSLLRNR